MEAVEYIRPELQEILEDFARIRDAYVALQTYSEVQEEVLTTNQENSETMTKNLIKLSNTCVLLKNRYESIIEKLQAEKDDQRKTIEELKEQCEHLRLINTDRNDNYEQVRRLEDEVEILKAQLSVLEEKHDEDMALLKQKHSDEIQRYKVSLQNAKKRFNSDEPRKMGQQKKRSNNENYSLFRWPELSVQKINNTEEQQVVEENANKNKKRKLFHEDSGSQIDIH